MREVVCGDAGDRPFTGAKAAILIGEQLLVTLRDDRDDIPYPNLWDLPGGGREGTETAEATMLREVFEEVGLRLTADSIIWRRAFPSHSVKDQVGWFFVIRLPETAEAQIVFGDEGQGWALESPAAFMARRDAVPFLQHRFGVWLAAQA